MFEGSIDKWRTSLPIAAQAAAMANISLVARDVIRGEVCFLFGAGMSKASGGMLGEELAELLARQLLNCPPAQPTPETVKQFLKKYPLEAVAQAYVTISDRPHLNHLIREHFSNLPKKEHLGHKALEHLISAGKIDRIYTTNYDRNIEDSLGERAIPIADSNIDEFQNSIKDGCFPVLHLHGLAPQECLLEESETYKLDTPLARLLIADLTIRQFVWVGYQLSDPDLRGIYLSLQNMMKPKKLARRPYVILPMESDGNYHLESLVWDGRYAKLVPGKAEDFLPALVEQVKRTKAQDLVPLILNKRGGDSKSHEEQENLWALARRKAQESGVGDEYDSMRGIARMEGLDE